jgi:hypothetical protein
MLVGCVTTVGSVKGSCDVFRPITWADADTRPTKRQIVSHNSAGKRVCGWKPRK